MKKISLALSFLAVSVLLAFFSCTKINEATSLGGDLLPAVDNVNTFDTTLQADTKNFPFNDTSKLLYSDPIALGQFDDPDFGGTKADAYFRISSTAYGTYPFIVKNTDAQDSLIIDSVVLSLSYAGAYGDTQSSQQTVRVFEIDQNSDFNDTTLYKFTAAAPTTSLELGSKTFRISDLDDSVPYIRGSDTFKTVNTLRIKFNSNGDAFAKRIAGFDTVKTHPNGGFYSDSIFKTLVKGLAIVSDPHTSGQGALAYFNLSNTTDSRLTIFFKAIKMGQQESSTFSFIHASNGQANIITRSPGGNYAAYLGTGSGDKIYLQSTPGSYVSMKFPGLDAFPNKVIHRAEIIATRINSPFDDVFTPPSRLIVDRISNDSAYILEKDLVPGFDNSLSFDVFGGNLRSDGTYRFNITRYVQGIVTRHEANDTLRLYAPLRTILFATNLASPASPTGNYVQVPVLQRVALGRVALGGGTYPDPKVRLQLRIIYSNL